MSVKRPVLVAGAAILVMAAAAGAWLTRPPETAAPRAAKAEKARPATSAGTPPASPAPLVVPQAEAPPEPTSADFARSAPPAPSAPPPEKPKSEAAAAATPTGAVDWAAMPIDELRARANAEETTAMEELARRLIQGVGVAKDQQVGAGWLLRAAERGSPQAAFNVGVMYERGFVVERDSTRAVEWYRKAAKANLPMAKHNLALLLRDGKGAPRNVKEAVELLRSASRQGMSASMFALGDFYERGGEGTPKDPALALAWFAITAEFERQTNRDVETALAKTALQRAQDLRRTLLPQELERAQQVGQSEFKQIVDALQPPRLPDPVEKLTPQSPPAGDADPPGWPKAADEQVRVIQQALVELKFLNDKPDGVIGPLTRAAIRGFQRSVNMPETGEPTKDVFAALQKAKARPAAAAGAAPATPAVDPGKPEPPPAPPTSADIMRAAPKPN